MREVEKFRPDRAGIMSPPDKGSGTSLLERCWTLFHPRVADYERRRAGVAILIAPPARCLYVEVYPGEGEDSLSPPSDGGTDPDYSPNTSTAYAPDSLEGLLENASSGDSQILLGDINAHVGLEGPSWKECPPPI